MRASSSSKRRRKRERKREKVRGREGRGRAGEEDKRWSEKRAEREDRLSLSAVSPESPTREPRIRIQTRPILPLQSHPPACRHILIRLFYFSRNYIHFFTRSPATKLPSKSSLGCRLTCLPSSHIKLHVAVHAPINLNLQQVSTLKIPQLPLELPVSKPVSPALL